MKIKTFGLLSVCLMILLVFAAVLAGCRPALPERPEKIVLRGGKAAAVVPEGEWGPSVAGAYDKANCVKTYYDPERTQYSLQNSRLSCYYDLETEGHKLLRNLTSPSGGLYVEEAEDVFVRTYDGVMRYASATGKIPRVNMFRHGIYYSDVRILESTFSEIKETENEKGQGKKVQMLLDHTFHLYGDKLNSVAHVVATMEQTEIDAIGLITRIGTDTVDSLVIKDASGIHTGLEGVDFETAEYAGFHIKDVGVIGFILLPDDSSGRLTVEVSDGKYNVVQERSPENGIIKKKKEFYIGRRLYTDENSDCTAFVAEAEFERHPLTDIKCETYDGYDALRGAYVVNMGSTNFNEAFFNSANCHYPSSVSVTNPGDAERSIYILTTSSSGCLECSALLGKDDMMLPITVEVHKNFCGENEETTYDPGDKAYGEGLFPLTLKPGQTLDFTVLNLFQNWGATPLKQLSSIQFGAPYYHLSTGVTETTCIAPWYVSWQPLWTLTDFRPMSAPFWYEMEGEYYGNQPQHTHGGYQYFLKYTNTERERIGSENVENIVLSSGPSYASVNMKYLSYDGKILVSYTHTEMPQTDENRAYYEMKYEVLEDLTISDFRHDFQFYSAFAYAGQYQTVGYLDKNNKFAVRSTINAPKDEYVPLGSNCPYFALYHYQEDSHNGFIDNGNNTNLGCSIKDWTAVIGGRKYTGPLIMALNGSGARLTLDLKKVTLKKGDWITINMIISPWGYQLSDNDENVRNIRNNSCLDPFSVSCDKSEGTVISSGFLPAIRAAKGTSVEYTLSGGNNNCVYRIYGIEKLARPALYEFVDGEWVPVCISSAKTPDSKGYAHEYDGYSVFYDGNGTYSYAFVCNMTGTSRRFRLEFD